MNQFTANIGNSALTANGALTLKTSTSPLLDLFFAIGSARNTDITNLLQASIQHDLALTVRILLWARHARGGAGERKTFENCILWMTNNGYHETVIKLIPTIPQLGRWDDLLPLVKHPLTRKAAVAEIRSALTSNDALCAKWMPREKSAKKDIAKILMRELGMPSYLYRTMLASLTKVVETEMCAKQFKGINFDHVPSLAMARYKNAFSRNAPEEFGQYIKDVQSGEVKVKATSLFPHDIIRNMDSVAIADAQWKALENYIPEGVDILPIVDVSASMHEKASGSVSCMDISIALGIYLTERQTGAYRDFMVTFESNPKFVRLPSGNIAQKVEYTRYIGWGGSTNFEAAMFLVLNHAKAHMVPQEHLPDYLICISDMEFDEASDDGTNFEMVKRVFELCGYRMPKLIFWQVNGREGNVPVKANQPDVILVSGFSPAIMKSVLSGNTPTPESAMFDTIMVEAYDIPGVC